MEVRVIGGRGRIEGPKSLGQQKTHPLGITKNEDRSVGGNDSDQELKYSGAGSGSGMCRSAVRRKVDGIV